MESKSTLKTKVIAINENELTKLNPLLFGPYGNSMFKEANQTKWKHLWNQHGSADGKHKTQKEVTPNGYIIQS
jgi:hypothetical protein